MIPLEKQVTSLELSKQLKDTGVKQDSVYYWTWAEWNEKTEWVLIPRDRAIKLKKEKYSAFTVAELGEMLPARIKTDYGSWNYLLIVKLENTKEWLIGYYHDEIKGNTLANACAKMLIYLIEHKLVEVNRNEKNENAKRER